MDDYHEFKCAHKVEIKEWQLYWALTYVPITIMIMIPVMPVHGLIHDGQLWACPCALLGLMHGFRRLYAIRYLGFQLLATV
jgi:hypothetical protein